MVTKYYNKLVRDKIPEIIKAEGKIVKMHRASTTEYRKHLAQKLQEEVIEFLATPNTEELADIHEVLLALRRHLRISPQRLERIQETKCQQRGGFSKKSF